jgi:hypothetical protein
VPILCRKIVLTLWVLVVTCWLRRSSSTAAVVNVAFVSGFLLVLLWTTVSAMAPNQNMRVSKSTYLAPRWSPVLRIIGLFEWKLILHLGHLPVVGSIGILDGVTTLRNVVGFGVLLVEFYVCPVRHDVGL